MTTSVQKQNRSLRVALAQLNLRVGDLLGNTQQSIAAIQEAKVQNADVILFPELTLTSYPTEDMVFRGDFLAQVKKALEQIKAESHGITVVIGYPALYGGAIYNAAVVMADGENLGHYAKQELPNYKVYDEERWFVAGEQALVVDIKGVRCGILVCDCLLYTSPSPRDS